MSADSIKDVEAALVKRYAETYGLSDETFRSGFGVSWAKLKDAVAREAAAERAEAAARQLGKKVRSVAIPYTAEQCAGLLKLSYKSFNELARTDGAAGRLVPEQSPNKSRVVASISLVRLLEWAEGVPKARDWRASREDGEILGATRSSPEVRAKFQDLKGQKVRVVLSGQDGAEGAQRSSSHMRSTWVWSMRDTGTSPQVSKSRLSVRVDASTVTAFK